MKKLALILLVLVGLSWGACHSSTGTRSATLQTSCSQGTNIGYGCSLSSAGAIGTSLSGCGGCITPYACATGVLKITSANYNCGAYSSQVSFSYIYYTCDTQAELDSLKCELDPTAQGCIVEKDTTIFYCKNEYSLEKQTWRSYVFKCGCKSANGEITGCNGKQNVDVASDCTPYKSFDGLCGQNGYEDGPNAAKDSTGANADCFAVIGSKCHMRDKASGNTFTCDCDGMCDVALRNLMAGNASCENPYPQPSSSDGGFSLPFQSSSSAQPESSEGSGGGTSSGGEGESSGGEGASSSSLYDPWSPLLEDIKANTQGANTYLNNIQNNTETANSLLQAIVNKDWSPTINVAAPNVNVNVAGDTNIINVQGDTAKAPAEILAWLKTEPSIDTSGRARWNSMTDSIVSSTWAFVDSMETDSLVPDMGDSLADAANALHLALSTLKDSIDNSAISDSMTRWQGLITNNGVITGEGSNDCPAILSQSYSWEFPLGIGVVQVGSLGTYLCTPIAGLNVTLWTLARVLLRAFVAIGCMLWIYKAVLGIDNSGEDD